MYHVSATEAGGDLPQPGIKVSTAIGGPAAHSCHLLSLGTSRDGRHWVYTLAQMNYPPRVGLTHFQPEGDEKAIRTGGIPDGNEGLLAGLDMPRPESVTVPGAGGAPMQMWILKPPGFDASKKWPLAFLVHGGPQGAWEDGWSYRWNPELWAAQGYVVALPNPRGSTGFGQKYME